MDATNAPFQMSQQDRDITIRTMLGEEGDPMALAGVASTMINRARAGTYGGPNLQSVALAPGQFDSWADHPQALMAISPNDPKYQAAGDILDAVASGHIPDPTGGATYFYAPGLQAKLGRPVPAFAKGQQGVSLGSTMFYRGKVSPAPASAAIAKATQGADPFSDYPTASAKAAPAASDPFADYPTTVAPSSGDSFSVSESALSAPVATKAGASDPFSDYPTSTSPAASPAFPPAPATPIGVNDAVRAAATGVPIAGGLLNRMDAATNATLAPVLNRFYSPADQLQGTSWSDRYNSSLATQEGMDKIFAAQHPVANTALNVSGGIAGTLPAMLAAPAAFGAAEGAPLVVNALVGATTGAGIGATDNVVRNGLTVQNAKSGAFYGGLGGALGPVVGAGVGKAVGTVSNMLNRTSPEAVNMANMLRDAGMTPNEARAKIASMGSNATFADVHPLMANEAQGIASLGGTPTAVLKNAAAVRGTNANDNMAAIVNKTLGPKPDAQAIVNDIKTRTAANTVDNATAKAALDASLGMSVDPYEQLQKMIQSRSAAAAPLYAKAMQGGSVAPLETQFSNAFSDATDQVSQTQKALISAQQQQTLAAAKASQAGNNVYANSAASRATQEANSAVSQAQEALTGAQQIQQAIRTRLRAAQADGTASAPGAIWNPRIQQFLDDPIVKPAIAQGVKIQRLESLAEGKPFNPTEYAIIGTDANGDPIVGSVPNMRTLNIVKKGLDAMVENAKDSVTGRLSEEGRAFDMVRRAYLGELDKVNPDYAVARQSWAGLSAAQDAFNQGQSIFRNNGVNSTPGALAAFMAKASDGEQEAAKLGTRAAFNAQMQSAANPAAKAAMLANKGVTQQKLAAVLGPDEANSLIKQLTSKYEDLVGSAFSKGMDIFQQRQGVEGVQDTPDALKSWMKTASPAEIEAHQQGARQAIEQALSSARQGDFSQARSLFAKSSANRHKLETVFPKASDMLDALDSELKKRATESAIQAGSQTAEKQSVRQKYTAASGAPFDPTAAILGEAVGGGAGAAALTGAKAVYGSLHNAFTSAARKRLIEGTARGLVATGPEQQRVLGQVSRAYNAQPVTQGATNLGSFGANLLSRQPIEKGARFMLEARPLGAQ